MSTKSKQSPKRYLNNKKYTYEYFTHENVCRLCWKITNNAKSIEDDALIAKTIVEHIGLNVKGHILQKVCCSCANKIKVFANFKKFCLEADRKLDAILSAGCLKSKIKLEKDEPIIVKKELKVEIVWDGVVKKEEKKEILTNESSNSNLEDFHCNNDCDDKLLPTQENKCNLNLESVDDNLKHSEDLDSDRINEESESLYECCICKKKFQKISVKLNHEVLCRISEKMKKNDSIKFKREKLLAPTKEMKDDKQTVKKKYYKKKERIFKCAMCSEIFENSKDLTKHKLKHINAITCICEVCGRVLKKTGMAQHMLIHTNFKQLKCPHCDYHATIQHSLNIHIRRLHTAERPYACDMCPYKSGTSSGLAAHRKTHLGLKNYICHICNKSYAHKVSLLEHITVTHEGVKRFTCKQCGSQYYRFKGLRKHILVKHGKKVKKVRDDFVEIDMENCKTKTEVGEASGVGGESTVGGEESFVGSEDVGGRSM